MGSKHSGLESCYVQTEINININELQTDINTYVYILKSNLIDTYSRLYSLPQLAK